MWGMLRWLCHSEKVDAAFVIEERSHDNCICGHWTVQIHLNFRFRYISSRESSEAVLIQAFATRGKARKSSFRRCNLIASEG